MDDDSPTAGHTPAAPSRSSFTPLPFREDCWSEDATSTLIDAWGDRYLELNRGNLRQKHWQEVANAVNARHGHIKKARRTDVQCKNRIDTLKKKYKIEKAKVAESDGGYVSQWPFLSRLDTLLGNSIALKKPSPSHYPSPAPAYRKKSPALLLSSPVPVAPRSVTSKRPALLPADDSCLRKNFSAFAAAAAAAAEEEAAEEGGNSETSKYSEREGERDGGYKDLAQAIERFGEIYERVEGTKQRQLVELEKQRMQFAKDLEVQRMKLFVDTQIQLERIKRAKRSNGTDGYS